MDPASAIGVASAAITFLDFSIDVCKTFSQIVTSDEGITKHNADVAATVKKYKGMAEALKTKGDSATTLQLGAAISSAVEESIGVYTELLALVERLGRAKDAPVIGTFKALYRSMRSRRDVERLQRKAETSRSMVIQGLLEATWETSTLGHESSTKAFQHLDKQDIEILAALKAGNSDLLRQLIDSRQHFDTTVSDLQDSVRTDHDHITQKIDSLTQRVMDMDRPDLKKAFVDSLFFPYYDRREKALSGPSPKTFEWIFNQDGVAGSTPWLQVRWPSFTKWLENTDSSQQYWLSGKAGSGKSTLMAHIIRDDMALNRTKGHLKKWHGTKALHVLKFFLFRPGREQQAGLESLLRSLLYQLVNSVPPLQETLMARFLPQSWGARIPAWSVETLKSMLRSALDAADECCFLIFIDGADEFEDFQHLGGRRVYATDLVHFLFNIQQPQHVKLCVSSRPELRITHVHPSFLEAKLADLNHDDIRRFVDEQMKAMIAIPELEHRNDLARAIAHRADGIFLWAAFAVTQIKQACFDGYGEDYSALCERLDDMGEDLNDAISQMLQRIEKRQRPALAFYLQALKSWRDCGMRSPLDVGLIALSRSAKNMQTRSEFLAACRKERSDIQNFSQGILEVSRLPLGDSTESTLLERTCVLVRSHSDCSSESDLQLQREHLNFEPGEGAWITVACSGHYLEIWKFFRADVSFIHRSAYDFFFAPNDWSAEHAKQCRSLLGYDGESNVHAKLRAGLKKRLWIEPRPMSIKETEKRSHFAEHIMECFHMNITYARHTASPSLTQGQLTSYLDDLLSSMRLELLLGLVKAPIFESRKHVPGDIFSRQLQDGYLQTLDEDRLVTFESTGLKADLDIMADFEARFLWHCASRETLHGYVQKHLHALTGRAIAPLIQTSLLKRLAKEMKTGYLLDSYTAIDLLQNFVQSWFHTLARTHRSFETHNSVWKWIVRLASGSIDIPGRESPNGTRLSVTHSGPTRIFYQWTPLASGGTAGFHEERMINALVLYTEACFNLSGNSRGPHIIENLARILDPWNVWIGLPFDLSVRGTRTVLFIYTGSLSTATFKICQGHPSDSRSTLR